jgi:hypothetical protein
MIPKVTRVSSIAFSAQRRSGKRQELQKDNEKQRAAGNGGSLF